MAHVFISYVREDAQSVELLCDSLREKEVKIWIDRNDIPPGTRWKQVIRKAINEGDFFIACFSPSYIRKRTTYMNEEITVAIDMLRQKPTDRAWFIPVLLFECEVPDRDIGAGETLLDIQQVRLYEDWETGIKLILSVIKSDIERAGGRGDIRETDTAKSWNESDSEDDVTRAGTKEDIRAAGTESVNKSHYETVGETISVLFLAANPSATTPLRLDEELREVQSKILQASSREHFNFEMRWASRPADLQRALISISPRIVHFVGHHGTSRGELVMEDESGRSTTISTNALVALFRMVRDTVDCVILNVSYSSEMATAIAKEIKYVIGISEEISDRDAISFVAAFYQSLAAGRSIEEAFKLGSAGISLSGTSQNGRPVLIMRG